RRIQHMHAGTLKAEIVREYDSDRDLLTSIRMDWDPAGTPVTLSRYDYRYDLLGRRKDVVYSGAAFGGSGNEQLDLWAYNNRNELTGVNRHAGSNPDLPGAEDTDLRRAYNYDPIGNRKTYTEGTAATLYYCANALNQYEETGAD